MSEWVCDNLGGVCHAPVVGQQPMASDCAAPRTSEQKGRRRVLALFWQSGPEKVRSTHWYSSGKAFGKWRRRRPGGRGPGLTASGLVPKAAARRPRFELAGSRQP